MGVGMAAALTGTGALTALLHEGYTSATALSGTGTLTATAVAATTTPIANLIDTFETQNTAKWTYLTGAVATGGQLVITPSIDYPGINSVAKYDLTESHIFCNLTPPNRGDGTNGGGIQLIQDVGYSLSIAWEGDYLFFQYKVNTVADSTSVPYDAVDHKWLQIRETGGQIYWETSPTGIPGSWTTQRNVAAPIDVTALTVDFYAGFYGTVPTPGTMIVDYVNALPTRAALSTSGASTAVMGVGMAAALSGTGALTAAMVSVRQLHCPAQAP